MTDARADVPVDDDNAPIETDAGHADAPENVHFSPATDDLAAVSRHSSGTAPVERDPTTDGQPTSAPRNPDCLEAGTAAQEAPAGEGLNDPGQEALRASSVRADSVDDAQIDPDRHDPVPVAPAAIRADPARADPAINPAMAAQGDPVLAGRADPAVADQASPAMAGQADPAMAGEADPAVDGQPDPAMDGQADPAVVGQAGSVEEAQVAVDQAQTLSVTADSTLGQPSATVPAAPPLRDPDEAALRLAEAAVFASATPVTPRALSQILPDDLDPAAVIAALQARYQGRGLELCEIGGGLQFRTAADLAPQLRKVVQVPRRLPRVALETLAIVAYHQPITRPEIEDLRGTGLSQQTLDVLLENDLIVARGRKETPGRPTLWGTTAKFLEYFGLRDIRELPRRQDLLLEAVRPEAAAQTEPGPPENPQPEAAGTPPS
jgi:segregation and condensation protein B